MLTLEEERELSLDESHANRKSILIVDPVCFLSSPLPRIAALMSLMQVRVAMRIVQNSKNATLLMACFRLLRVAYKHICVSPSEQKVGTSKRRKPLLCHEVRAILCCLIGLCV